ncbi:hypothetical protein LTR85_006806 [Meristemomyces frigidus]|nr:hypothetical protein LTR85_006806 [Meristemomyces frigidus]
MPLQTRSAKRKADAVEGGQALKPARKVRQRPTHVQDTVDEETQSPLLKLPAELRNAIYRLSVVERNKVMISSRRPAPPQPGIMQVSRQVRAEIVSIYYKENTFGHIIRDYDYRLYRKWCLSSKFRVKSNMVFKTHKPTNWANLLEWVKAWYHGECGFPGPLPDGVPSVECSMVKMAVRMRDRHLLSWDEVASNLEDAHQALVAVNPAWA